MDFWSNVESIPVGKSGNAEIVRDKPSQMDIIRSARSCMPLDNRPYTRLLIDREVAMTDAHFEKITNLTAVGEICKRGGDVLVAGLGIGMILAPIMKKCGTVTVVEKNLGVIELVGPSYPLVRIVVGDVWEWAPDAGSGYDSIYFDIWNYFNTDTSKESERLVRKFKKWLNPGGWIGSWCVLARRCVPARRCV